MSCSRRHYCLGTDNDLCQGVQVLSFRKGVTSWPDTRIIRRRVVRCPYASVDDPIYASADCLYCNGSAHWSTFSILELCPDPPFTVRLDTLFTQVSYCGAYFQQCMTCKECWVVVGFFCRFSFWESLSVSAFVVIAISVSIILFPNLATILKL